jgi:hypothetical protein
MFAFTGNIGNRNAVDAQRLADEDDDCSSIADIAARNFNAVGEIEIGLCPLDDTG